MKCQKSMQVLLSTNTGRNYNRTAIITNIINSQIYATPARFTNGGIEHKKETVIISLSLF